MRATPEQSACFLAGLYGGIEEGYLNVWSKQDRSSESKWYRLTQAEMHRAAADAAAMDARGWDVYFGVCPSIRSKSGSERTRQEDVACVPAYFMDVDTGEDGKKAGKRVPESVEEAVRRLKGLEFPPSACVRSGHGLHAYWLLSEPIRPDGRPEALKERLRAFADAVAHKIDCPDLDAHASEPARVLRMPGTHNHKGGGALPVGIEYQTGTRYAAEALDGFAQSSLRKQAAQGAKRPAPAAQGAVGQAPVCAAEYLPGGRNYLEDDALWQMLFRKNGRNLRLRNGDLSDYGGDHSAADLAMCNELAFATGKNAERMDELFRSTGLYRPKWDEKHGDCTYGERTIRLAAESARGTYDAGHSLRGSSAGAAEEEGKPLAPGFESVQEAYRRASGGAYAAQPYRTAAERVDRHGNVYSEPLADFVPVPVETVIRHDGCERTVEYVMEGYDYLGRRLPRVNVPCAKLDAFRWVADSWPTAVIEPGTVKKDKLRAAIQKVARETSKTREVFVHTGWREMGGGWRFLYHGGAVGAEGISVELSGKLQGYSLPEARGDERMCVRKSLDLLKMAPLQATAPLLASMYLSPLLEFFACGGERVSHMLTVRGKTQSKKSVLTALFLSHFGTGFTYNTLPLNFQSTANAICGQLFRLKDVPAVVDDFHPTAAEKRAGGLDEMTKTARRINRAVGDDAGRARMLSDGKTLQADRPARGLVIITAEFEPDLGESGDSRCFVAPLNPGDVMGGDRLDEAQAAARCGDYARAMRGYIGFVAEKVNADQSGFVSRLCDDFREKRRRLNREGEGWGGHGRLATAGAHLLTAVDVLLEYAREAAAVDGAEADRIRDDCRAAILKNLTEHAESVRETDPMIVFAQALSELGEQEYVIIKPGDSDIRSDSWIGYQTADALYLSPKKAFAAVSEMLRRGGSPFPISGKELWRRLYEAGAAESETARTQHVPGLKKSLYAIRLNARVLDGLRDGAQAKPVRTGEQTASEG